MKEFISKWLAEQRAAEAEHQRNFGVTWDRFGKILDEHEEPKPMDSFSAFPQDEVLSEQEIEIINWLKADGTQKYQIVQITKRVSSKVF